MFVAAMALERKFRASTRQFGLSPGLFRFTNCAKSRLQCLQRAKVGRVGALDGRPESVTYIAVHPVVDVNPIPKDFLNIFR